MVEREAICSPGGRQQGGAQISKGNAADFAMTLIDVAIDLPNHPVIVFKFCVHTKTRPRRVYRVTHV